ncbi:MAG: N-acetyl-gamma-glutamyl-phosphate reductase [Clostridiales bacterium]|nr:N-acetyl-gamma-glutamyl-phosphate reductase [Clostridiales bacterium]
MIRVFVDGGAGTTGLRIGERLAARDDIERIVLKEEFRKDAAARKDALNSCDAAFLCLPDAAAKEAAAMVENPNVVVLDASTAHRTNPDWAYGFAELSAAHRNAIATGKRIAVPGCHASGFIALVYPMVASGILPKDALLSCHSMTGYSGGGKTMIADYEADERDVQLGSPRQYALGQTHKHLPEMAKVCGLTHAPIFSPVVSDYYAGMAVTVGLFRDQINGSKADVEEVMRSHYASSRLVKYADAPDFFAANTLAGRDSMEVSVAGNDDRILLLARFDNLGKGASGAAVQCMNIAFGLDEATGLNP